MWVPDFLHPVTDGIPGSPPGDGRRKPDHSYHFSLAYGCSLLWANSVQSSYTSAGLRDPDRQNPSSSDGSAGRPRRLRGLAVSLALGWRGAHLPGLSRHVVLPEWTGIQRRRPNTQVPHTANTCSLFQASVVDYSSRDNPTCPRTNCPRTQTCNQSEE